MNIRTLIFQGQVRDDIQRVSPQLCDFDSVFPLPDSCTPGFLDGDGNSLPADDRPGQAGRGTSVWLLTGLLQGSGDATGSRLTPGTDLPGSGRRGNGVSLHLTGCGLVAGRFSGRTAGPGETTAGGGSGAKSDRAGAIPSLRRDRTGERRSPNMRPPSVSTAIILLFDQQLLSPSPGTFSFTTTNQTDPNP